MIKSIEVQKFKKFKKPIKLEELSPVNYLIGKNNSGKSSFLQAILLSSLYRNNDGSDFDNFSIPSKFAELREYFSDEDISNPIKISFNNKNESFIIESQWQNNSVRKKKTGIGKIPRTLYIPCSVQITRRQDGDNFVSIDNEIKTSGILPIEKINSWVYHQERRTAGGTWGKKESKKFNIFKKIVKREFRINLLLPEVDDHGSYHFKYLENNKKRNLYLLGGGTQNTIYFIAAVVYLNNYDLVLIDEPELHLHPEIQKKLGSIFKKLSEDFDIQFIVATQSPFMVSNLTKDDSVYILEKKHKKVITKAISPINVAVAMELGAQPSDVGAPENFILLEEASMEEFLKKINKRFFNSKNLQFISCSGVGNVPKKEGAINNIISHNLILKCTPIYSSRYFVVTDKLTKKIKEDKEVTKLKNKIEGRFIEMNFNSLEEEYPIKYLEDFVKKEKNKFRQIRGNNAKERVKNWIYKETCPKKIGTKKRTLASFVGKNMDIEEFKKIFDKLLKIFES